MTDPVEVIARAMCDENLRQEGRPVWPCDPDCGTGCACPKVMSLARAALSALEGGGMVVGKGWQPIETAPKDQFILLWVKEDGSRWLAKWQGGNWYGVDELGLTRCSSTYEPTHWHPLPRPPEPR